MQTQIRVAAVENIEKLAKQRFVRFANAAQKALVAVWQMLERLKRILLHREASLKTFGNGKPLVYCDVIIALTKRLRVRVLFAVCGRTFALKNDAFFRVNRYALLRRFRFARLHRFPLLLLSVCLLELIADFNE